MSKKIITIFLSLFLFAGQSGLFALGDNSLKTPCKDAAQTVQDEQARKKRMETLVAKAEVFHQELMKGKVTEEQLLESIYVWRDGIKDAETGKILRQITPEEANLLIRALDLQDFHEKKETIKAIMMLKAQVDQKKISKQWFKRRVLKILFSMYHKGLITRAEMEKLKQKLGLVSISQRMHAALNMALKCTLVIGVTRCLTSLISSSSERFPKLVKALRTSEVRVPVGEFFVPVDQTTGILQKVVDYRPFKIGFCDKVAMVAKFIFGVNESASGALNRTTSVLH